MPGGGARKNPACAGCLFVKKQETCPPRE